MNLLNKLFFETWWFTYYRNDAKDMHWKKIYCSGRYWCADPFVVKDGCNTYAFCEVMDTKKSRGLIGCVELDEDNRSEMRVIMDLGCHASYPNVFKYDGSWFMIPETSARRTIELYRAVEFPYIWDRGTPILNNINAVDTTIFIENGIIYVFIYEPNGNKNRLSIGVLNLEQNMIEDIKLVKEYDAKIGRPAGGIINKDGQLFRPTQYGVNYYGERIDLYKITDFPSLYNEIKSSVIDESICSVRPLGYKYKGIHTYNLVDGIEIIDKQFRVFKLLRPIKLLFKRFHIGGYK